jgi:DHA2 family multidrug resistance protein
MDSLAFGGYFQTVRLFGGQLTAAFLLHFLTVREQFHSNILTLGVQLGDPATQQRLLFLGAGMAPRSTGANMAIGRALELLNLQVRQQAFTLAIADSFRLVAWSTVCSVIVLACTTRVRTQYRQVMATVGEEQPAK